MNEEELEKRPISQNERNRFVLQSDLAVFNHLEEMFNEHVKRTDKVLVGGDCLLNKHEIDILIELIEIEEERLNQIFLDEWEFQVRPKVVFRNHNSAKGNTEFNQTRAYLAEKAMLNSKYEIRKGKLDSYELKLKNNGFKSPKLKFLIT